MTENYTEDYNPLSQGELKIMNREEVRREVMKGVNEVREGRFRIYESSEELADEIIRRGKARLKAKKDIQKS
jgi:hypothetical protein